MLNEDISSLVRDIDRIGEQVPGFVFAELLITSGTHGGTVYTATIKYWQDNQPKKMGIADPDPEQLLIRLQDQVKLETTKIRLLQAA